MDSMAIFYRTAGEIVKEVAWGCYPAVVALAEGVKKPLARSSSKEVKLQSDQFDAIPIQRQIIAVFYL